MNVYKHLNVYIFYSIYCICLCSCVSDGRFLFPFLHTLHSLQSCFRTDVTKGSVYCIKILYSPFFNLSKLFLHSRFFQYHRSVSSCLFLNLLKDTLTTTMGCFLTFTPQDKTHSASSN